MIPVWISINYQTYKKTKKIPGIIAVLIPYHFLAALGICLAVINWQWIYTFYFTLGWIVFGGIGSVIFLHKYASHRSIEIRPALKPILYTVACLSGQGPPIWWAALHRGYHHPYSDKDKDFHSPKKGMWHAYLGWMFYIGIDSVNLKYAGYLLKDSYAIWFHNNYNTVVWLSILVLFLIDPMFCLWFCIIPAVFALHMDCLVNTRCHIDRYGYKNFSTNDSSRNIWWLGYLNWGQGWHNNHHYKPNSFNFGYQISGKLYEFDPSLLLIPFVSTWKETKRIWKL